MFFLTAAICKIVPTRFPRRVYKAYFDLVFSLVTLFFFSFFLFSFFFPNVLIFLFSVVHFWDKDYNFAFASK